MVPTEIPYKHIEKSSYKSVATIEWRYEGDIVVVGGSAIIFIHFRKQLRTTMSKNKNVELRIGEEKNKK